MRLKNKKTGEIVDLVKGYIKDSYYGQKIEIKPLAISNKEGYMYNSLAELNEEWCDYEEPKEYWFMDYGGRIKAMNDSNDEEDVARKEIGNYFDTREEAELAVRKLKAWKRLKDKGIKAFSSEICGDDFVVSFKLTNHTGYSQSIDDFDYIFGFGGEE